MRKAVFIPFMSMLCSVLLFSCRGGDGSYVVQVEFDDNSLDGRRMQLLDFNYLSQEEKVEGVATVQGKTLEFRGDSLSEPTFSIIMPEYEDAIPADDENYFILFVRDQGKTSIKVSSEGSFKIEKGGRATMQFENHRDRLKQLEPDFDNPELYSNTVKQEELMNKLTAVYVEYIQENIQNRTGEEMFLSVMHRLPHEQAKKILEKARPAFTQREDVLLWQKQLAEDDMSSSGDSFEGGLYIDVEAETATGKAVKLSSIVEQHKITLVDFWASWCGPCIQDIPHLKSIYSEFKDKGLEIVGISVDDNARKWQDAVSNHQLSWIQLRDVAGGASQAYDVSFIPFKLLIDKDGKILGQNLNTEQLRQKLSELLN